MKPHGTRTRNVRKPNPKLATRADYRVGYHGYNVFLPCRYRYELLTGNYIHRVVCVKAPVLDVQVEFSEPRRGVSVYQSTVRTVNHL